ncbi:MAG: MCE family protein [Sporichthyaceae bacterium]
MRGVRLTKVFARRRRGGSPRRRGAIAIIVVLGLLAVLYAPSGLALGKTTYYAELARSGGLQPGDEVRVAGVGVGQVGSVELAGSLVRVSFRVGDSLRLGSDSRADVRIATLLGNHVLALTPGGSGTLPDRTIPLANTSVPFEVQDIIEAGAPALEKLDGDKLRRALAVLADGFRDTPALTRDTLESVARLSEVVVMRREQLDRLVSQTAALAGNLDDNRADLIALLREASLIFDEVTRRRAVITELLTDTRALARVLRGVVADNQRKLTPLLKNLNVVLTTLQDNDAALREVAILLGPASRYFANAAGNGPYLDVNGPNAVFPDSAVCGPQGRC